MSKSMEASDICVLSARRILPYQFFREWLVDSLRKAGVKVLRDVPLAWSLRLAIGKLGLCFPLFNKGRRLLVLTGGRPEYFSWPWCYSYEIVPVVWDCWPRWFPHLVRFVKRNNVKTIFCTSSQTALRLKELVPSINAVWLPEGIDSKQYPPGPRLTERTTDVLELGRQKRETHEEILRIAQEHDIRHLYQRGKSLLFGNLEEMTAGMRNSKIAICYPRCDTHPEFAGDIETLTQRYWECMLSGTLMVGRAPKELVDFCGYNPVVELTGNVGEQLLGILNHISDYQDLVDKNRKFADAHASWDSRVNIILENLK